MYWWSGNLKRTQNESQRLYYRCRCAGSCMDWHGVALPHFDSNARMPNCQESQNPESFSVTRTRPNDLWSISRVTRHRVVHADSWHRQRLHIVAFNRVPKTLVSHGYVTSHPNGYCLEAERAEHEKWLIELGYEQPLSSINGS